MRILQVVDSLDPIYGGPPTVVLRLAAALAYEGAQVTLYSQERSGREADIAATLRGIPGIELVRRVSDVRDGRLSRLMCPSASPCALAEGHVQRLQSHISMARLTSPVPEVAVALHFTIFLQVSRAWSRNTFGHRAASGSGSNSPPRILPSSPG